MAIVAKVKTEYGEDRDCYIRLNSVDVSNHGVAAVALFRAFLDKDAFDAGARYVAEYSVAFSADVSQPIWAQAYEAFVADQGVDGVEA